MILLPLIGKTDLERRMVLHSIGPVWEGNQVWFIFAAGAIFAAWPALYALVFSGFYYAMFLILFALMIRAVGIKYRSKLQKRTWRLVWDWALFMGGLIPAFIFGVAIGNILQGVPFHYDENLRPFYTGTFLELLNPYALCCGIISVFMVTMQGGFYLAMKTAGHLHQRARRAGIISALILTLGFIFAGFWLFYGIEGYMVSSLISHDAPSNPLYKTVMRAPNAWFFNYMNAPAALLLPLLACACLLLASYLARHAKTAFILSSTSIFCIMATVGISMFPFILPSSSHPNESLLVWDSSSSETTLLIMLLCTSILFPIVIAYTAWVYRVLRGKVTTEAVFEHQDTSY